MPHAQPISENDRSSAPVVATAGQTVFPYDFLIKSNSDILVQKLVGGIYTTLTLGVDYTVTGVDVAAGGTVVLTVGATVGDVFSVDGKLPLERSSIFFAGQTKYVAQLNDDIIRLIMGQQERRRDNDASLKLPRGLAPAPFIAKPVAGQLPVGPWNDDLDGFEKPPSVTDIANAQANGEIATAGAVASAASAAAALGAANSGYLFDDRGDAQGATIPGALNILRVMGYATAADGGAAAFARSGSEPAHVGKLQSADGAWWEIEKYTVDARRFGSWVEGTDISVALQAAVDYATFFGRGAIVMPPGAFKIENVVAKAVAGVKLSLVGHGIGVTELTIDALSTNDGILIDDSSRTGQQTFRDFSMVIDGQASGTALRFTQVEGGSQHQRALICERVQINGLNLSDDYIDRFFDFTGAWRPLVTGCVAGGPWVGVDLSDGSNRYKAALGIQLEGCYDWTLHDNHIFGVFRGIGANIHQASIVAVSDQGGGVVRVETAVANPFSTGASVAQVGTTDYNGIFVITRIDATHYDITTAFTSSQTGTAYHNAAAEACRMTDTVVNGVRIALDWVRPAGNEPLLFFKGGHVNYRDDGLKIDGARLVTIDTMNFYNEDAANNYAGVAHDINLVAAQEYVISSNTHHFSGATDRINVFVQSAEANDGDSGIIANNIFNSVADYAVWISLNCDNIRVGPNLYSGTYGSGEVNDVSGDAVIIKLKTVDDGTWTPVLTHGGDASGFGYDIQTGSYDISGGNLHFHIDIKLNSNGSGSGATQISLPTALSGPNAISANKGFGVFLIHAAMAGLNSPIARPISATQLALTNQDAGAVSNLDETNFTDTSAFQISGTLHLS